MFNLNKIFIVILQVMMLSNFLQATETITVKYGNNEEMEILKYPSHGDRLLIMLPSEHGITDGLKNLAQKINKKSTEVWIADSFSSLFLAPTVSSLAKIPIESYVNIIKKAQKTKKKIYLYTNDKGSALLLKAVRKWQLSSKNSISGVVLVSPNLYLKTPEAGNEGVFLPIASATNLPISIFIPKKSTLALRINNTIKKLKQGGSDIKVTILKNVRDRFFFREDASKNEKTLSLNFANMLVNSMKRLKGFSKYRKAVRIKKEKKQKLKNITRLLQPYKGKLIPENFTLQDINQKNQTLFDYKGKVILLNFWASWCPPCIKEIPSMIKLQQKLKNNPFKILAINLGEDKEAISKFAKKYKINFSILLDPNQKEAKLWKIFAFPTSFIIDKTGKIRYSIAGGFQWDSAEGEEIINTLMNE